MLQGIDNTSRIRHQNRTGLGPVRPIGSGGPSEAHPRSLMTPCAYFLRSFIP